LPPFSGIILVFSTSFNADTPWRGNSWGFQNNDNNNLKLDSFELVDVSNEIPELKRAPGLSDWKVTLKTGEVVDSWDSITQEKSYIFSTMFPPTPQERESMHLERWFFDFSFFLILFDLLFSFLFLFFIFYFYLFIYFYLYIFDD
jgi:hypothetical protein